MIIILVVLIIMLIAIMRFDVRTVLSRWIAFGIFGLVLAVFSLIVYSVNMWDYSYFVRKILLLNNKSLYLWVYYLNLGTYTVIRFLNIGIALFLFCITAFAFEYFYALKYTGRRKFVRFLVILPVLYIICYDPFVTNAIYHLFFNAQFKYLHAIGFFKLIDAFNLLSNGWMTGYLVISLLMLIFSLKYAYHDRIKRKTIMLITNLMTIYLLFKIIFYWFPRIMFTPRGLNIQGQPYTQPYVGLNIRFISSPWYYLLIAFSLISTLYFLLSIYKYNTISLSQKRKRFLFESAYKSANLSSRVFIHAFKNDLFAIQTLSDISEINHDDDGHVERLREIHTVSSTCMRRFDLLKKATSPAVTTLEKTNIVQVVNDAVAVFTPSTLNHVEIEVIPHTRDLEVYVDKIQILEVVRNLIINGIESIKHNHGKVVIRTLQKGRWVVIEVEDNGIGLSKNSQRKIFAPYFSTKPSTSNWGLGLSFSRKIVQMLDGDILVSSTLGLGSIFSIFLPILSKNTKADTVYLQALGDTPDG